MPLGLELPAGGDVHLPVLVVVGDHVHALVELAQDRLRHRDRATGVQLLVVLDLTAEGSRSLVQGTLHLDFPGR